MENIIIKKQTMNWEQKKYYQKQRSQTVSQKVPNKKKSNRYGYYADDAIAKYGVMQFFMRSKDYDLNDLVA